VHSWRCYFPSFSSPTSHAHEALESELFLQTLFAPSILHACLHSHHIQLQVRRGMRAGTAAYALSLARSTHSFYISLPCSHSRIESSSLTVKASAIINCSFPLWLLSFPPPHLVLPGHHH
jgi:hypothetical protein